MTMEQHQQTVPSPARRRLLFGAAAAGAAGLSAAVARPLSADAAAAGSTSTVSFQAPTVYDVTNWRIPTRPKITAAADIGAIMNDIIRDIKTRQTDPDAKPGAVIIIPPGDYELHSQVVVDVSFLTIAGYGHGFTSLGIAYNSDTSGWHERKPGGSHVKVMTDGPAILVHRDGSPRLSGIVFRDFCLDGLSFTPDQNSYANGKTGIEVSSDNDAFHITGMGLVYLEHGLVIRGADALRVHDNFIVECGSCLEMTGAGQATLVTNNLMGAGPHGPTILAENHEGLLISGNNLFPRGRSIVELHGCVRSSVTANRMQGFYPGMVRLVDNCKENLLSANHFRRAAESYQPFVDVVGLDDLFGVVFVRGDNNLISNNLFAYDVPPNKIIPSGGQPTMILVAGGDANVIATNHVVCNVASQHVVLDGSTTRSKVLDSGATDQITSYAADAAVRPTP